MDVNDTLSVARLIGDAGWPHSEMTTTPCESKRSPGCGDIPRRGFGACVLQNKAGVWGRARITDYRLAVATPRSALPEGRVVRLRKPLGRGI